MDTSSRATDQEGADRSRRTAAAEQAEGPSRPQQNGKAEDQQKGEDGAADKGAGEQEKPKQSWGQRLRAHPWIVAAVVLGIILVAVAGLLWWLHARHYESTDDAFIDARTVTLSPQIAGAVTEVDVTDNQIVEQGAVLAKLDDSLSLAQLAEAEAQVDQADAAITNLEAQLDAQQARIDQAGKEVEQADAARGFAQQEHARYEELARTGSGTVQQEQQAQTNLLQAEAGLAEAQANQVAAEKQLLVLRSQRHAADAALEAALAHQQQAQTNLSFTVLTAPVAGRVTQLTAAKGTYVAPGQAIALLVPREVWVTANFKEAQLTLMRPGQPVRLSIDAYPDQDFAGRVDSIQAGSGTAFSLLPAENATGNYVKIVQRVPVKITFDQPPDVQLGPGMSVVPTVTVQ